MSRIVALVVVGLLGLVGVAQATQLSSKPYPIRPPHPTHPGHPPKPKPKSCSARSEGYNASGTLVSAALTPAAGHDRYSGTIVVAVVRANHRAGTSNQSFTLTDARIVFHHGVDRTAPAAGSRVRVHGKITELPKGCSTSGFTPAVTVRDVDIRTAPSATP